MRGGSRELFLRYFEIKFKFSHRIGSTCAISLERDKSLERGGAADVFGPLKSKFLKFFFCNSKYSSLTTFSEILRKIEKEFDPLI